MSPAGRTSEALRTKPPAAQIRPHIVLATCSQGRVQPFDICRKEDVAWNQSDLGELLGADRWWIRLVTPKGTLDLPVVTTTLPSNDNLSLETGRTLDQLQDREVWLSGQRLALTSALSDATLTETLNILVDTAVEALGQGVQSAFHLTASETGDLCQSVGMSEIGAPASFDNADPAALAWNPLTRTAETVLITDMRIDPRTTDWAGTPEHFGYRGFWGFPILTPAAEFLGTYSLYWPTPRSATACDIEHAALIVQTAAIIISRYRERDERRKAERALLETQRQLQSELADSEMLRQIGLELAGEDGEQSIYQKLVDAAAQIMKSDVCTVQFFHPERGPAGELEMLASTGLDARSVDYWKWVRGDSGCTCGEVLRTGRRAIADNVETCAFMAGTPDRDVLLGGGIRAGQSTPLVTRDGKLVGMISTHWGEPHTPTDRELRMLDLIARQAADLIERRRAAEMQRLLMNELNHRVKNTLAVVQAMATRTLARSGDPKVFAKSFGGRVQALARTHDLLSAKSWQGADLRELIEGQVSPGGASEARLLINGPCLQLEPQMALHLALIFHELGTNATKYGALSSLAGRVHIDWHVDDALHIRWTERGGPQVEPAASQGFGTTLISQSVRGQGGDAEMVAHRDGIVWEISVPYSAKAGRAPSDAKIKADRDADMIEIHDLKGRRILVVEDEPLIGMDIVAILEDAGAEVEGPIASIEEACRLIAQASFDFALVDANLHGHSVGPVAQELAKRSVPFAFATGYDKDGLPEDFKDRPILGKPCCPEALIEMAARMIGEASI